LIVDAFGGEMDARRLLTVLKGTAVETDPCLQSFNKLKVDETAKTTAISMLFDLDEVSLELYQCFCDQIVARMAEPGCEAPHILILKGREGIGKTMLARHLAMGWLAKSSLRGDRNDVLRTITGNLVCEVAELNFSRTESSRIKDIISSTEDQWHEKYKKGVKSPRRCVFVGTTNEDTPLPQDTDGRRYWIIDCQPSELVQKIITIDSGLDRRKAWEQMDVAVEAAAKNDLALAKRRLENDETALPSRAALTEAVERHRANTYTDDALHNLLAKFGERAVYDACRVDVSEDGTVPLVFTLEKFTQKLLKFTAPKHANEEDMDGSEIRRWHEKEFEKLNAPSRRADLTAFLKRMGCKDFSPYLPDENGKKKRTRAWQAPSLRKEQWNSDGTMPLFHGNNLQH